MISVAAIDRNDQLASFSDYGATTVAIAAPGVSIYSTMPNNTYSIYSGTSMAAPHVSGVAAWAVDPNATVAQVRNAILQGATCAASAARWPRRRLDAYATLKLLEPALRTSPWSERLSPRQVPSLPARPSTFIAIGITDAGDVITGCIRLDVNNNGKYEAGGRTVLSTSTIDSGAVNLSSDIRPCNRHVSRSCGGAKQQGTERLGRHDVYRPAGPQLSTG